MLVWLAVFFVPVAAVADDTEMALDLYCYLSMAVGVSHVNLHLAYHLYDRPEFAPFFFLVATPILASYIIAKSMFEAGLTGGMLWIAAVIAGLNFLWLHTAPRMADRMLVNLEDGHEEK